MSIAIGDQINSINLSASTLCQFDQLESDHNLSVNLSSAAKLQGDDLKCDNLKATLSSAASLNSTIDANRVRIETSEEPRKEHKRAEFEMDFERMLAHLSLDERTVMLLYFMDDFTIERIATIMEMPRGTVKSHLHRGRKRVKDLMKQDGYER